MADFFSRRFGKDVWITHHARKSMERRDIDDAALTHVIEAGEIKHRSNVDLWIFKHVSKAGLIT